MAYHESQVAAEVYADESTLCKFSSGCDSSKNVDIEAEDDNLSTSRLESRVNVPAECATHPRRGFLTFAKKISS